MVLPVNMPIISSAKRNKVPTSYVHSERLGWVFVQQIVGSQSNVRDGREKGLFENSRYTKATQKASDECWLEGIPHGPAYVHEGTDRDQGIRCERGNVIRLFTQVETGDQLLQEVLSGDWEAAVCASFVWKALFSATVGHFSLENAPKKAKAWI